MYRDRTRFAPDEDQRSARRKEQERRAARQRRSISYGGDLPAYPVQEQPPEDFREYSQQRGFR